MLTLKLEKISKSSLEREKPPEKREKHYLLNNIEAICKNLVTRIMVLVAYKVKGQTLKLKQQKIKSFYKSPAVSFPY